MRVDLFQFVDGLIRGIIHLLYNFAETVGAILRHPIRGPIQLYVRHRKNDQRQVGGLTFLFLLFLIAYFAFEQGFPKTTGWRSSKDWFVRLGDISNSIPQYDTDQLWPVILSSLVSVITIDATLRLILGWRLAERPRSALLILAATEYSFFWIVGAVCLMLGAPSWVGGILLMSGPPLVALLIVTSALPAAVILQRAFGGKHKVRNVIRAGMVAGWAIIVTGLFGAAGYAGMTVGSSIQETRDERTRIGPTIHVQTLDCGPSKGDDMEATGLVWAEGKGVRALKPSDFVLQVPNPTVITLTPEAAELVMQRLPGKAWADPDHLSYVIVSESSPQLIELTVAAPPHPVPKDAECRLRPQLGPALRTACTADTCE